MNAYSTGLFRNIFGILLIVLGTALTATILGAVVGIPLFLLGLYIALKKIDTA